MDLLLQKENNMSISNRQSTLDSNKNSILFCNNGKYFSFGKDNSCNNKLAPNTSSFNIKDNVKISLDNNSFNNNSNTFLNKKRKLMTSEELELEQIERERKEVKKMMKKNMELYYRTKSGTTTIVSKIRENIYNLNNNVNKSAILNNYINNNNINKNNNTLNNNIANFNGIIDNEKINRSNSSYTMNFLKEKGFNKINVIEKTVNADKSLDNNKSTNNNPPKEKIIEIINTDIEIKKSSVNDEKEEKEEKEKEEDEKEVEEKKEEEIIEENETIIDNNEKKDETVSPIKKTPNKESSYLTKMKQLGSMSKLPLCNKIQKYTEICQEVLKEQEKGEGIEEKKEKEKKDKKHKGKKKNKKSDSKAKK
jgi:hypothetical protein